MNGGRVVAIGLLTQQDLTVLGQGFRRVFWIEQDHDFGALLTAIDDADRARAANGMKPIMMQPMAGQRG